ncbi:MAG TPA: DUF1569 domain-containing protein [Chitinophagaceae bacterium]
MEIKNLFDPAVKREIIERINKLTPDTNPKWGKMNVSQMLAHVQLPIRIAYGTHTPKGSFLLRLIGPLFKSQLWNETPYKQSLPTDPTFVMTGEEKEFEKEKATLLELVNNFNEAAIPKEQHPVFGKISKHNWSKATWKHLDHHLRQFGV